LHATSFILLFSYGGDLCSREMQMLLGSSADGYLRYTSTVVTERSVSVL